MRVSIATTSHHPIGGAQKGPNVRVGSIMLKNSDVGRMGQAGAILRSVFGADDAFLTQPSARMWDGWDKPRESSQRFPRLQAGILSRAPAISAFHMGNSIDLSPRTVKGEPFAHTN
jgi:hypothetical protein